MNMIKQVQMFQALDGSHHTSERGALLSSVAHVLECTEDDVLTHVEPNLSKLLPLLSKLNDPRNRPAQPEQQPVRLATEEEAAIPMEPIDTRTFEDLRDEGDMVVSVDPGDLRFGQLVEFTDGLLTKQMVIEHVDVDGETPCVRGRRIEADGSMGDEELAPIDVIRKVLKQPEDMMDAQSAVAALAKLDEKASTEPLSPLDQKRRILLHRRIEALEDDNA